MRLPGHRDVWAVEDGPLGCWLRLGAQARPDGRALLHDPQLGGHDGGGPYRLAAANMIDRRCKQQAPGPHQRLGAASC